MEKIMTGKMPVNAVPAVIVGAIVGGKPNYNLIGCYGLMSIIKPTVYISSARSHHTNSGIRESGYFSVNVPSVDLVRKADYVGLVSGRDTDKSGVFTPFFGVVDKAPMAEECPVNILCRVTKILDMPELPGHEVFVGEVIEVYVSKDRMAGDQPDIKKVNPLLLGGRSYWGLGDPAGTAWKEGIPLIKR